MRQRAEPVPLDWQPFAKSRELFPKPCVNFLKTCGLSTQSRRLFTKPECRTPIRRVAKTTNGQQCTPPHHFSGCRPARVIPNLRHCHGVQHNQREGQLEKGRGRAILLPLRLDRGLEELGRRRKEFTGGEDPPRAERVGASESLGRGEVSKRWAAEGNRQLRLGAALQPLHPP